MTIHVYEKKGCDRVAKGKGVAKFIVSDWGNKVDSGISSRQPRRETIGWPKARAYSSQIHSP